MYDRRLAVKGIRFLTGRHFVLEFDAPEIAAAARPGQFLMVATTDAVDPLLRRPMAVAWLLRAGDRPVGFAIVVEQSGRGTRLLARLRPGDSVAVLGPLGRPFRLPEGDDGREHLLVMGGVGAAPFPFVAEALRAAGCRVRAFVGGRTREDLLCVAELEALGAAVVTATEDGSAGVRGLVTEPLEAHLRAAAAPATLYSCGTTAMMRAVQRLAERYRLPHQASLEAPMACGLGVCLSCVVRVGTPECWSFRRVCREGPVFDGASLLWPEGGDARR